MLRGVTDAVVTPLHSTNPRPLSHLPREPKPVGEFSGLEPDAKVRRGGIPLLLQQTVEFGAVARREMNLVVSD
jgi:hypothetical protein